MNKKHDPYKLPVFKGYTVDMRLQEFRLMKMGQLPEFIPFDSVKGRELLNKYNQSLKHI